MTSLSPDHLDWHGSVERYYADKLSLCTKPGVRWPWPTASDEELRASGALGPHLRWVTGAEVARDAAWSGGWGWPDPTIARNASVARAVLDGLGIPDAADEDRLADAARHFTGLPSRCHSLGTVGAIEFVDDSLSTNVLPTQAALDAFADRPSHCSSVATTGVSTTRRSAGPSRNAHRADARGHHARQRPRIGQAVRGATEGRVEVIDAAP